MSAIDIERLREDMIACIPALRRFGESLTKNRDAADDLVQETLERALRKLHLYQPTGSLVGWLCTIMRHQFLDQRRRKPLSQEYVRDIDTTRVLGQPASQEDTVMLKRVAAALDSLPAEQRDTVRLVAVEGLSYEEAAQRLGIPIGTVRSRLSRARRVLNERVHSELRTAGEELAGGGATEAKQVPADLAERLRYAERRIAELERSNAALRALVADQQRQREILDHEIDELKQQRGLALDSLAAARDDLKLTLRQLSRLNMLPLLSS